MRILGTTAAVATLMLALTAVPATAKSVVLPQCTNADISPTAISCSGFFAGNLISGNASDQAAIMSALNFLDGYTGTAVWSEKLENLQGTKTIDFNTPLNGITYVGIHFGGARGDNGPGASATAFYKFNAVPGMNAFDINGLDEFLIKNYGGSSNAALFFTGAPGVTTAVPEPAAWMMMILTVGFAGAALRHKRRIALPTAAIG